MPSTINGIGTTYYGKKNPVSYQGVCESCGSETMLEDYECTLFFCLVFIPIIPLGRKQIIGYCRGCTRHKAMPLIEWQRIKEDAIDKGLAELAENKGKPEVAMQLLRTLTTFHEQEQAKQLAAATQSQFQDDVDVQLGLGTWYEESDHLAESNRCFDRAYELDPQHPGAIRARGITILQAGQLEEAHVMLAQLAPPSPGYDPTVFFLLGTAYQERHQHEKAIEMFALIQQNSPDWAKDKSFRKALKKSQKARA
ncbi:MAG: tetratricopeptide repeat protein [Planctomycetes bacterium]|nr:tetratricopeptide repeat protein [Planctomycetota bacterium]